MGAIAAGLQAGRKRIARACHVAGRQAGTVTLLAVSKTFPEEDVRAAHAAGQFAFGESYLQEALVKQESLADLPLEWHFIGPIQSNKTRPIAEHFSWVHGVDRLKIAQRLSEARPQALPPLNICIQINVSGEISKHGVDPSAAILLAQEVVSLPRLRLRGFMAIPKPCSDIEQQRGQFAPLRKLLAQARDMNLDTLSMGMSDDLEAAIMEGATLVRIGTAIFGRRSYSCE